MWTRFAVYTKVHSAVLDIAQKLVLCIVAMSEQLPLYYNSDDLDISLVGRAIQLFSAA